jgi:hypothetical protein
MVDDAVLLAKVVALKKDLYMNIYSLIKTCLFFIFLTSISCIADSQDSLSIQGRVSFTAYYSGLGNMLDPDLPGGSLQINFVESTITPREDDCTTFIWDRMATYEEIEKAQLSLKDKTVRLLGVRKSDVGTLCLFKQYQIIETKNPSDQATKSASTASHAEFIGDINALFTFHVNDGVQYAIADPKSVNTKQARLLTSCHFRFTHNPANQSNSKAFSTNTRTEAKLVNVTIKSSICYFDDFVLTEQKKKTPPLTLHQPAEASDCDFDFPAYLKKATSEEAKGKSILQLTIPKCALTKDKHYSGGDSAYFLKNPSPYSKVVYRERILSGKLKSLLISITDINTKKNNLRIVLGIGQNKDQLVTVQKIKGKLTNSAKKKSSVNNLPRYIPSVKKSAIEGDYITGKLKKIQMDPVESSKSSIGYSQYNLLFELSDILNPAPTPVSCHRYILGPTSSYSAHTQIDYYKKMIQKGVRMFLTHVRNVNNNDNCQVASITPINKHEATAKQASDLKTTSSQKTRRDSIYSECKASPKLNRHYRCDCHADKALGIMKLFPSMNDNTIQITIQEDCVNIASITAYEFKRCATSHSKVKLERRGLPVADFCNCYAKKLETLLVIEGNPSPSAFTQLKANARTYCNKPENL